MVSIYLSVQLLVYQPCVGRSERRLLQRTKQPESKSGTTISLLGTRGRRITPVIQRKTKLDPGLREAKALEAAESRKSP